MTVALEENPNYTGPSRGGDLLVRDVLAEQLSMHGLVTPNLEEQLASTWERQNNRALLRTWEENGDRTNYRARLVTFGQPREQSKLTMDPDVAREEIERLERTANPAEYASRINELRVEVLGLEPAVYGDEALAPAMVRDDQMTAAEVKWKLWLAKPTKEKQADVERETDLSFLDRARHGPRKDVSPALRKIIVDRVAAVEAAAR